MENENNEVTKYTYEVWALGFDKDNMCTDIEKLLGEFDNKQEAIYCAEQYNSISDVALDNDEQLVEGDFLEIRVEQCVEHDDWVECEDVLYSNFIY